jgi:drug/metabolite transporter (DMT)-like permease
VKFMMISALIFSVMNLIAKSLDTFNWSEIVFYRSFGSLIICAVLIKRKGISFLGNQRGLLLARGLCGTVAMCCFFMALQVLPLATTTSLRYLSPVFGAIMAVVFLKNPIRPIQWLFFLVAFLGVLLMKGFDARIDDYGLLVVMISAVFTGAIYVIIQKIGKGDDPLVVIAYFMASASIAGLIFTGWEWSAPSSLEWAGLLSLGVLGFGGQYYMTKALQCESTVRVAPLKYLEAIFSFFLGWLWLGETYTWVPIVGMLLIIAGMVMNVVVSKK